VPNAGIGSQNKNACWRWLSHNLNLSWLYFSAYQVE